MSNGISTIQSVILLIFRAGDYNIISEIKYILVYIFYTHYIEMKNNRQSLGMAVLFNISANYN